jgi:hypothetical protein
VKEKAADVVGEANSAGDRAAAIGTELRKGYYSQGLTGQAVSLPGHGIRRISDFLKLQAMVGDSEQYAATAGLMARALKLPARVVLGWIPDAKGVEYKATGDKITAWIEVFLAGPGWVPIDVTPDRRRVYNEKVEQPQPLPQPQVQLPPPPLDLAKQMAAPFDEVSEDKAPTKPDAPTSGLWRIIGLVAVIVGLPVLVMAVPILGILFVKARRRRRRRGAPTPADRISGGWDEVIDRSRDVGDPIVPNGTRSETARTIPAGSAGLLASRADRAVFSLLTPSDPEADEYWSIVDDLVAERRSAIGRWARFKASVSLASLRRK